jgi:hypothetical protein
VDPYRALKYHQNQLSLAFYERFRDQVSDAHDGLEMAVRLAIAGNVIDLGVKSNLAESEIHEAIAACLTEPLDGDIRHFTEAIAGGDWWRSISLAAANTSRKMRSRTASSAVAKETASRVWRIRQGIQSR